ncbi:AAA domain-containing protein [Streptomyces sp. AC555_RSS877]|uniref:AAA domain-containing protein n=1 Tax=Streptomyces sp. AC555_RSS877 TaxID=2823688 RepID=UPI0020B6A05D|nr:AAA domain-containing protein [Streptomyces sp. AC555_RSS877]
MKAFVSAATPHVATHLPEWTGERPVVSESLADLADVAGLERQVRELTPAQLTQDEEAVRQARADCTTTRAELSAELCAAVSAEALSRGRSLLNQRLQTLRQHSGTQRSQLNLLRHLKGWAITTHAVRQLRPTAKLFDLVVIDEASQCSIASVLPLLFRARRALIIGDPMQLSHIPGISPEQERQAPVSAGLSAAWLEDRRLSYHVHSSYHAAAQNGDSALLLDEHYRCHPEIADIVNGHCYSGALEILTDVRRQVPAVDLAGTGEIAPVLAWANVSSSESARGPGGKSWRNPSEAAAVVEVVRKLLRHLPETATVGVVTPFRAQKDALERMVGSDRVRVGTVHAFQGGQRDVMVLVGRARYRRVTWATVSSILGISEDTARRRYTERYILRRLTRFNRSETTLTTLAGLYNSTGPRTADSADTPADSDTAADTCDGTERGEVPDQSAPIESSGAAYNRLSPILSMLIRSAQLTNKEVSSRIGCSASYLLRILSGERVPTWELTRRFAQACGADPDVLRTVWESEKLSQKSREPETPDPDDPPMPATERLRTAVHTLHLRAGRPAPSDIAVASRWLLTAAAVAFILETAVLPHRDVLATFVRVLGGDVDHFTQLLANARREATQGSAFLQSSSPHAVSPGEPSDTPPPETDAHEPHPVGADAVMKTFSKVLTEEHTVEDGRARLLHKHAEQQGTPAQPAERTRPRPLTAITEALRHHALAPVALAPSKPGRDGRAHRVRPALGQQLYPPKAEFSTTTVEPMPRLRPPVCQPGESCNGPLCGRRLRDAGSWSGRPPRRRLRLVLFHSVLGDGGLDLTSQFPPVQPGAFSYASVCSVQGVAVGRP